MEVNSLKIVRTTEEKIGLDEVLDILKDPKAKLTAELVESSNWDPENGSYIKEYVGFIRSYGASSEAVVQINMEDAVGVINSLRGISR